jgi:hypothetical protein
MGHVGLCLSVLHTFNGQDIVRYTNQVFVLPILLFCNGPCFYHLQRLVLHLLSELSVYTRMPIRSIAGFNLELCVVALHAMKRLLIALIPGRKRD